MNLHDLLHLLQLVSDLPGWVASALAVAGVLYLVVKGILRLVRRRGVRWRISVEFSASSPPERRSQRAPRRAGRRGR